MFCVQRKEKLYYKKYSRCGTFVNRGTITGEGADFVNWGPQANIGMGPYTFSHIYLGKP